MDNHLHGAGGGPGVDLSRARSLADVAAAVAARVKTTKPGEVIVSNSDWHEGQLREKRLPLRDDLDAVAPVNPVVLVRGGHEYVVNTMALRRWEIDERTAEPAGGRITRYPDGRLNGELVDTAKGLVKLPAPPARSRDERIAARQAEYATLHAAGLTTVRHPGISVDDYRLLQEMQRRGLLTMRVNALLRPGGDPAAVLAALDASGLRDGDGDAWLRVGGVKLAVDGGFEGGLMREPYAEPWGEGGAFKGLQIMTRPAFEQVVLGPERSRLARGDPRRRRRGHRSGPRHLRAGERPQGDHRAPLVDRARVHRPSRSPAAHQGAGAGAGGPEPSLSGRAEPGGLLGPGAGGPHHAGAHLPRRRTAGVVGHRRAGRAVSAAVDALPLRHPRHALRRRARPRSAGDAGRKPCGWRRSATRG